MSPARTVGPPADLDALARGTYERLGGRVVLAAPLGIGKPNHMVDAFYRQARGDRSLELRIFTALSLARPTWSSDLERRFLEPFLDRVFADYPDPRWALDLLAGELPDNVRVTSFYYAPGSALGSPAAQRAHTNTNYTHVVRGVIEGGVNCLCQMVAVPPDGERDEALAALDGSARPDLVPVSLSSNPDLTLDLLPHLLARRDRGEPVALLAQVNRRLPFMYGDAVVDGGSVFDVIVDDPALEHTLFSTPSRPVALGDWSIGLNASALIRDGGTLQLGIGALGDAVSRMLLVRNGENGRYRRLLEASGLLDRHGDVVERVGGTEPFAEGLHGSSEMLMQGLLELLKGGVIRRPADDGHHLRACFFLGPGDFYEDLRTMPPAERRRISMTRISEINELFGEEERKRRERRDARFLNTGMVATLLGAVASDGLEDGRVVSGVGGQYNFVSMAHELEDGRSVLMVRAAREEGGDARSNVRFAYGHTTIPRHLRDLLVTEYGVADLRGRSDDEVVREMLCVADSRFQDDLLEDARRAGKVDPGWEIPDRYRGNTPERLAERLGPFRDEGVLPEYPFGSELTEVEKGLARALRHLKRTLSGDLSVPDLEDVVKTLKVPDEADPYLDRMALGDPDGVEEQVLRRAVVYGLAAEDVI